MTEQRDNPVGPSKEESPEELEKRRKVVSLAIDALVKTPKENRPEALREMKGVVAGEWSAFLEDMVLEICERFPKTTVFRPKDEKDAENLLAREVYDLMGGSIGTHLKNLAPLWAQMFLDIASKQGRTKKKNSETLALLRTKMQQEMYNVFFEHMVTALIHIYAQSPETS